MISNKVYVLIAYALPMLLFEVQPKVEGLEETKQKVDAMLDAIQTRKISYLTGDDVIAECTRSQQDKRHRYVQDDYNLDMWTRVTCTMNIRGEWPNILATLNAPNKQVSEPNLQTLYLPLYAQQTASFTCVPRTLIPTFFVTALLTGCDVFVAAAEGSAGIGCPIVVIHSNYCDRSTFDKSHQAAIAVLSLLSDPEREARYQIRYRLASEHHQRDVIEPHHYHYDIDYYDSDKPHIFFGYTHGGSTSRQREPWVFCRKEGLTTNMQCHVSPDF